MGRPLRIEFEGAVYHITSRGNEQQKIFIDNSDRKKFLNILEEYHKRFSAIFHCFVLMDDHYHFLLETPLGNLISIMHGINSKYTGYFNKRHKRVGHLFQGRYRAILVDKEAYLFELNRYIHLNPVRAGICKRPEDYLWSSYKGYINPNKRFSWVEYNWILNQFSKNRKRAIVRYKNFVEKGLSEEIHNPLENVKGGVVLGGELFLDRIRKFFKDKTIDEEIIKRDQLRKFISPEAIINIVCSYYRIPKDDLRQCKKNNLAKKVAVYLIYEKSGLSNREIALLFGEMHYSAVSHSVERIKKAMKKNKELLLEVEKLRDRLNELNESNELLNLGAPLNNDMSHFKT